MVSSKAPTVTEYLADLMPERREVVSKVREVMLASLPLGIEENMNWGMISYEVPLSVCPKTYNGKPLMFAALAAQKHHYAVYLSGIYSFENLRQEFERDYLATGKRYDVGKGCVRFRKLEDLPLDVIAKAIGAVDVGTFVARYKEIHPNS